MSLNDINSRLPAVSVIIITKNRRDLLKRAINSIRCCDYPVEKIEIVVFEETSHPERVEGTVYREVKPGDHGFGWARRRAVESASHGILLFTDDDCTVEPSWIKNMVEMLISVPSAVAVAGAVKVPPTNLIGKSENILGFPGGGSRWIHKFGKSAVAPSFSTCNVAIKRQFYDKAGGFDEMMKYGSEDSDLSERLRKFGSILYCKDGVVYHLPRAGFGKIFTWFVKRGRAENYLTRLLRKNRIIAFLKNSILLKLAAMIILSFALSFIMKITTWIVILFILFGYYIYLLFKYLFSWKFYRSICLLFVTPLTRLWMDAARDFGFLLASIGRKQKGS